MPKKRSRKLPGRGLGVSPNLPPPNSPQEWGIKGAERAIFRRIDHAGVSISTMKYKNADTSSPWPPSPAEEGGGNESGGVPQTPLQRGSASLDSPLFPIGIPQGAKPVCVRYPPAHQSPQRGAGHILPGVWGCPPDSPSNSPKNGGQGVEKAIFERIT